MGRPRNPARDESKKRWLESGGKLTLKTIAEQLNVSAGQVRKWKSADDWAAELNGNVTKLQSERYQTMRSNRNAEGNPGGHAPAGNKNAVTHGLFAKWLPAETAEIVDAMADRSPIDLVWDQIVLQYAAIIRAQKIMYVTDSDDLSAKRSGYTDGAQGSGETFALQYAWDKQANFLSAQSRAIGTLGTLIKQFTAMASDEDERTQQLQKIQESLTKSRAAKAKADTRKAKAEATMSEQKAKAATDGAETTEARVGELMDKLQAATREDEPDGD